VFEFLFPKFSFIEFVPHIFPAFEIGKSPHPRKGVLNREKGTKDFDADFLVLGDGFGFKDFEKFGDFEIYLILSCLSSRRIRYKPST